MPPCHPPRQLVGRRKDGSEFPVEVTPAAVETAEDPLVVLSFHEPSEQAWGRQLAVLSELGRRALAGIDPLHLMGEAAELVRKALGVEYANVLELLLDGRVLFQAGGGLEGGPGGKGSH
jgi:hypothetical protein